MEYVIIYTYASYSLYILFAFKPHIVIDYNLLI